MRIAFIGLGNMGSGMAANQAKAGHDVTAFDLSEAALVRAVEAGCRRAGSVTEAVADAEVVITMLPAGPHVRKVYEEQVFGKAPAGALLIDCSTIDPETAREVAGRAQNEGYRFADAPVSGGTAAAEAGTLAFMVGGSKAGFARAEPILQAMGRKIVHCGEAGAGQAAKLCNNMILAATMIATCEGFILAERLGLTHQALFDVVSNSSGNSWAMSTYCPVPGPVPGSPANRDYKPGFSAALMAKDLGLAQESARGSGANTPLGAQALELYRRFLETGGGDKDFSGIIEMLRKGG